MKKVIMGVALGMAMGYIAGEKSGNIKQLIAKGKQKLRSMQKK